MHAPEHTLMPVPQQTPDMQSDPLGQTVPQAPQLSESVLRSVHVAPQTVLPGPQIGPVSASMASMPASDETSDEASMSASASAVASIVSSTTSRPASATASDASLPS